MSESFAAFGIERVSPSELKSFAQDRGLWFAKKRELGGLREDIGAQGWRGDAVEAGLNVFAYGHSSDPLAAAYAAFEARSDEWAKNHDGEVHADYDKAREQIAPCLERAIRAWEVEGLKALGKPASAQQWCEAYIPDAPTVKIGGKWDWAFGAKGKPGSFSIDLKTTNSIPTAPKPEEGDAELGLDPPKAEPELDHAIQASLYALARGETTAKILYVSSKIWKRAPKEGTPLHVLITLGPDDVSRCLKQAADTLRAMDDLLTAALAMTEYMAITKERALARLCRPNFQAKGGGFYDLWKSDFRAQALEAVPAWK